MEIETDRLRIVPLTVEQFLLLLCDMKQLGENMNILFTEESLDYDTRQAMEGLYKESLSHLKSYHWYTNWQIILKSENRSVGSACFMKEPDDKGQVEIGYGIDKAYRNNGYMTEALTGMCRWTFTQREVNVIVTETDVDNYNSHRVLEKSGMKKYLHTGNNIRWRIEK